MYISRLQEFVPGVAWNPSLWTTQLLLLNSWDLLAVKAKDGSGLVEVSGDNQLPGQMVQDKMLVNLETSSHILEGEFSNLCYFLMNHCPKYLIVLTYDSSINGGWIIITASCIKLIIFIFFILPFRQTWQRMLNINSRKDFLLYTLVIESFSGVC